jgi:hypothetical protein
MRVRGDDAPELRVLSVQQPWAWLIVHGGKDIENRRWSTSYRGQVAIHASLRLDREFHSGRFPIPPGARLPTVDALPRGAIVGVVSIVDCVEVSASPWFGGPFGFVLQNARPIEPLPWRGALGLRRLPNDAAQEVFHRLVPADSTPQEG